ncbi:MAG: tRNA (N6-isopentenyl adenosine(37)-C2)-methylthiotransferase MiaB [Actinomycetota bacterium]|nr:tRNA (N6-isopentenyl adenosine(37)-C2)-methylthiotransferase MiaB [Actinomycetota bacterium]MDD5667892.1 tRNA (N6-isopentenyl adenosine(37)-C2)-methylthiotransferase MiaB [Actinomycetota bacterium]
MDKRYALLTFGCQMNLHDADFIRGALDAAGWRESALEEADAAVLLTCCVRQSAENRLYGRLASLKPLKEGSGLLIAVGGCMAQKEGVNLMRRAPHVDVVFGTHQYPDIAALLSRGTSGRVCATAMGGLSLSGQPRKRREDFRAWVTITSGCDNFCSYCIVPYVRGREESRTMEEVVEETGELVRQGVREVNLLGQNVNSFRRKEEGRSRFADLLRLLGRCCPEAWIRFVTSHPRDFDTDIMLAVTETANVCEYVHLPLQSGSDRVLGAMNRGYDRQGYLEKIRELRRIVPDVTLSTDLIVGFPGETEEDFEATLEMVELCRFDSAFTFVYNPREGTAAARRPDDVPRRVKGERLRRLAEATRVLTAASLSGEVGSERTVMVYGASRKDPARWSARTRGNKLVHFQRGDDDLTGRIARVRIVSAGSWSLHGELLEVI